MVYQQRRGQLSHVWVDEATRNVSVCLGRW